MVTTKLFDNPQRAFFSHVMMNMPSMQMGIFNKIPVIFKMYQEMGTHTKVNQFEFIAELVSNIVGIKNFVIEFSNKPHHLIFGFDIAESHRQIVEVNLTEDDTVRSFVQFVIQILTEQNEEWNSSIDDWANFHRIKAFNQLAINFYKHLRK